MSINMWKNQFAQWSTTMEAEDEAEDDEEDENEEEEEEEEEKDGEDVVDEEDGVVVGNSRPSGSRIRPMYWRFARDCMVGMPTTSTLQTHPCAEGHQSSQGGILCAASCTCGPGSPLDRCRAVCACTWAVRGSVVGREGEVLLGRRGAPSL